MCAIVNKIDNSIEILASQATIVTNTGTSAVMIQPWVKAAVFSLDVTAAATDATDTLDVTVQTTIDGTNWIDVVAFIQVLGNGGALIHVEKVEAANAVAGFLASAALSAGTTRDIIGGAWRCKWTLVDAVGDDASFTFSVTAQPM